MFVWYVKANQQEIEYTRVSKIYRNMFLDTFCDKSRHIYKIAREEISCCSQPD